MTTAPISLELALRWLQESTKPIDEIAELRGVTRAALDTQLRRHYRTTAQAVRDGARPQVGHPRGASPPRRVWAIRVTEEEREQLDAAVARGRAAGAATDGAALVLALAGAS